MSLILTPFKLFSVPMKFLIGIFGVLIASLFVAKLTSVLMTTYTSTSGDLVTVCQVGAFVLTFWSGYDD